MAKIGKKSKKKAKKREKPKPTGEWYVKATGYRLDNPRKMADLGTTEDFRAKNPDRAMIEGIASFALERKMRNFSMVKLTLYQRMTLVPWGRTYDARIFVNPKAHTLQDVLIAKKAARKKPSKKRKAFV